jgi:hypothetical protein
LIEQGAPGSGLRAQRQRSRSQAVAAAIAAHITPGQLVIDEVAQAPGIFAAGFRRGANARVHGCGEFRIEDVGHVAPVIARGRYFGELSMDAERHGIGDAFRLVEHRVGPVGYGIEAPGAETGERRGAPFAGPIRAVFALQIGGIEIESSSADEADLQTDGCAGAGAVEVRCERTARLRQPLKHRFAAFHHGAAFAHRHAIEAKREEQVAIGRDQPPSAAVFGGPEVTCGLQFGTGGPSPVFIAVRKLARGLQLLPLPGAAAGEIGIAVNFARPFLLCILAERIHDLVVVDAGHGADVFDDEGGGSKEAQAGDARGIDRVMIFEQQPQSSQQRLTAHAFCGGRR